MTERRGDWFTVEEGQIHDTPLRRAFRLADSTYRGHIVNLRYWYAPWPRMRKGARFSEVCGYSHPLANWPAVLKEKMGNNA